MTVIRNAERPGTFRVTWETVSEDSASMGDAEDRGWLDWGFRPVDDAEASAWDLSDLMGSFRHSAEAYGDGDRIPRWITVSPGIDWWLDASWDSVATDDTVAVSASIHRPAWITDSSWLRVCRLLGWQWRWG